MNPVSKISEALFIPCQETKSFVFNKGKDKCIVKMELWKGEDQYSIIYTYSSDNSAHPFIDSQAPGINPKYEREHEHGDVICRNSLSEKLIYMLLNSIDIHQPEIIQDNYWREKTMEITLNFVDYFNFNSEDTQCNYKIIIVEQETSYKFYFEWDNFNEAHPQYYPNKSEKMSMKESDIPKNSFTKAMVEYLFMSEHNLLPFVGIRDPISYKKNIINKIIPAIESKTDSKRTIITCIIPALWD